MFYVGYGREPNRVGSNRRGDEGVNEWTGVVVATGKAYAYAANLCNRLQNIRIAEGLIFYDKCACLVHTSQQTILS